MATATIDRTPAVGRPATYGAGSDRYPCTIQYVSPNGRELWTTNDEVMIVNPDGLGNGDYVTVPNPEGAVTVYTLRKNGTWVPKGCPMNAWYARLSIGSTRYYRDPSF